MGSSLGSRGQNATIAEGHTWRLAHLVNPVNFLPPAVGRSVEIPLLHPLGATGMWTSVTSDDSSSGFSKPDLPMRSLAYSIAWLTVDPAEVAVTAPAPLEPPTSEHE